MSIDQNTAPIIDEGNDTDFSFGGVKSKIETVNWDRLFIQDDFNVRDTSSYDEKELTALAESIGKFGLMKRPVVSKQEDGRLKIIQAHRRKLAIDKLRAPALAEVQLGKMALKDVPFHKVEVEVLTGLSADDETILMLDQGHIRTLTPAEIFKAVQRLVKLGWRDTAIISHIGTTKGKAINHCKVGRMASAVQSEYAKYLRKENGAINLSAPNVVKLSVALKEDRDKGMIQFGSVGGGPAFREVWDELVAESTGTKPRDKAASFKAVLEAAENEVNRPGGLLLFHFVQHMLGKRDGIPPLDDIINNICDACSQVFPDNDGETVTLTEGNITREL